jgi:cytoskeleton protein RodZ
VGEVARQLRLSVRQVEALEAGAFERLPGQVFVRGFIRNYARLVRLDPEPLLRELAPLGGQQALAPAPVRAEPLSPPGTRRWLWLALAFVVIVAALVTHEFFLVERPRPAAEGSTAPVTVPVVSTPVAKEAPAAAPPEAATVEERGATSATPGAPEASSASAASPSTGDSTPAPGESEIRLSFERDSWVEIRDFSGMVLVSQLHRGGTEQRVRGRPPFVVVIGNARGVRLTYNERAVDLAEHTRYDVARLTLQ